MTENEAIKVLVTQKQCIEKSSSGQCKINCGDCKKNIPIAYQEKSYEVAITALKEVQKYREIGTVEECREAVEKQKPKKPEIYTDTVQTMNGSFQRDVFECPVCGDYVCNVEDEIPNYCCSCGQKLEESEEE